MIAPRSIVEIGAGGGFTTRHLVEYCRGTGARCVVIDPAPGEALEGIVREAADLVEYHERPSLEVLDRADGDLYLIDGDHNWHTVSAELRSIADRARAARRALPVICLHDVGWPYGRRDLYYAPERVDPAHRRPHARRGIVPGRSELAESGGYNHLHWNALEEGGPANGVLTAVEDFIAAQSDDWRSEVLDGFHGLAVLWVPDAVGEATSGRIEELLGAPETLRRHIEALERARLELLVHAREMDRLTGGRPGRLVSWVARAAKRLGG